MSSRKDSLDVLFAGLAAAQLKKEGFTANFLISNYPQELKRFALSCDLGLTGVELKPPLAHEPTLAPAANYVISQALKIEKGDAFVGIPLPVLLECYERIAIDHKHGINRIPQAFVTTELCLKVLPYNGYAIRLIPHEQQTKEMALSAVRDEGRAMEFVSDRLIDFELCMAAVSKTGLALRRVPNHLRTKEVCLSAVSTTGFVLFDVPADVIDADICLAAITATGMAYRHVPPEFRSEALLCQAVKTAGFLLEEEVDSLTPLICTYAVLSDPSNLRMVPEHLCTYEICLHAITQDGTTLAFVPDEHRTDELITLAIQQSPQCIDCLTPDEKTIDRQRMAYFLDPNGVGDLIAYPLIHQLHQEYMVKNNNPKGIYEP